MGHRRGWEEARLAGRLDGWTDRRPDGCMNECRVVEEQLSRVRVVLEQRLAQAEDEAARRAAQHRAALADKDEDAARTQAALRWEGAQHSSPTHPPADRPTVPSWLCACVCEHAWAGGGRRLRRRRWRR